MSPMRALLLALLFVCLASLCAAHKLRGNVAVRGKYTGGLPADTLEEMYTMFTLLDHNKDGHVSAQEASRGVLSLGEALTSPPLIAGDLPKTAAEAEASGFPLRLPAPSLDAPDLIDFLVAYGRAMPFHAHPRVFIEFEGAVDAFLRGCEDVAPPAEKLTDISPPLPGVGHVDRGADVAHNTHRGGSEEEWTCANLGRHAAQSDYCSENSDLVKGGYCLVSCGRCPGWPLKRVLVDKVAGEDVKGGQVGASGVPVLITSDWHVEPWYATQRNAAGALNSGVTECKPEVSRFSSANVTDMWQCRDDENNQATCLLTGGADPPIAVHATHIEAFLNTLPGHDGPSTILSAFSAAQPRVGRRLANNEDVNSGVAAGSAAKALLFFIGDTQAHEYEKLNPEPPAITDLMTTTFQMVLSHFNADDVFWTPGNNDGPHYAIFVDDGTNNSTIAWADAVVASGIVTNALGRSYDLGNGTMVGTVKFFRHTGYYLKAIDPSNTLGLATAKGYVMILNNMLPYNNTRQRAAMEADLSWIASQGGVVYILGHFPNFMTELAIELRANAVYSKIITGFFAGHIHAAASTNALGFTQVPAITECALDTAFFVSTISPGSMNIAVTIEHDMWTYCQPPDTVHIANVTGWKVRPRSEAWLCRGGS